MDSSEQGSECYFTTQVGYMLSMVGVPEIPMGVRALIRIWEKLYIIGWPIIIIILEGKGRQQLLIELTITNLNKLQLIQLQMFCELV